MHHPDDDDRDDHHQCKEFEGNGVEVDENAPYRALDEDVREFWVPREVKRLRHPITALTFLRVRKLMRGEGERNWKESGTTDQPAGGTRPE